MQYSLCIKLIIVSVPFVFDFYKFLNSALGRLYKVKYPVPGHIFRYDDFKSNFLSKNFTFGNNPFLILKFRLFRTLKKNIYSKKLYRSCVKVFF